MNPLDLLIFAAMIVACFAMWSASKDMANARVLLTNAQILHNLITRDLDLLNKKIIELKKLKE